MNSSTKQKIKTLLEKVPFVLKVRFYMIYLYHRYLKYRSLKSFYLTGNTTLENVNSLPNCVDFFGYYNISPTNSKDDVLFLKVKKELARGSLYESAVIMFKNSNGALKEIYQTKAWNWQQGCMLQWLPRSEDLIIFNDYDETKDQYCSKIINLNGLLIKKFDLPINNISKVGDFALSLNYIRLAQMRPDYGYFNVKNDELLNDGKDGIWHIDLISGISKLIIPLQKLSLLAISDTMAGAIHKVNHIDINPSGTKFMFLHRWVGHKGRFMRLIISNPDGTELHILNGDKMTSHSCWVNDYEIISFCTVPEVGTGYFRFNLLDNSVKLVSTRLPKEDGHPSISPNGKYLITDTYPNKGRIASLILYNFNDDSITVIGRFHQPLKYNFEKRVDLHPKWSLNGSHIFFESAHTGKRSLFYIKL